jgi:hypothetical protein
MVRNQRFVIEASPRSEGLLIPAKLPPVRALRAPTYHHPPTDL